MKKFLILFLLISSEGMANECHKLPLPHIPFADVFRCDMGNEICYFSDVRGGYTVSCLPKPKSK